MRDGTNLIADVLRPSEPGRYPVLIAAAPYPRQIQNTGAPLGIVETGQSDSSCRAAMCMSSRIAVVLAAQAAFSASSMARNAAICLTLSNGLPRSRGPMEVA
jgi:hypothetical protein